MKIRNPKSEIRKLLFVLAIGLLLAGCVQAADANLPPNASFDPNTGIFKYSPSYKTPPGTYFVKFGATDGNTTVYQTVWITVKKVDMPPVFEVINPQVVEQGKVLIFTVKATDQNGDTISYFAVGVLDPNFIKP